MIFGSRAENFSISKKTETPRPDARGAFPHRRRRRRGNGPVRAFPHASGNVRSGSRGGSFPRKSFSGKSGNAAAASPRAESAAHDARKQHRKPYHRLEDRQNQFFLLKHLSYPFLIPCFLLYPNTHDLRVSRRARLSDKRDTFDMFSPPLTAGKSRPRRKASRSPRRRAHRAGNAPRQPHERRRAARRARSARSRQARTYNKMQTR